MTAARKEGAAKEPAKARAERPSVGFRALVKQYQEAYPDKWEALRLTPLQHGLDDMAEGLEKL